MSKFRKKKKGIPAVNTAALPDIDFIPTATEIKKLEDKSLVSTIYVGKSKDPGRDGVGFNKIQLNDKISTADQVPAFIFSKRDKLAEALHPFMTTSIKADKESNVGTIIDIRLKLRDVNALKINYSSTAPSN